MGRREEGTGKEGRHLQGPGRLGGHAVGQPDFFVLRFAYDLLAAGCKRILDAGCGAGRNSIYLAGLGFQVVSLDAAANKVREASDNAPHAANISFVSGRLESLPFASGSFDALVCTHVMEYMDADGINAALLEFRRVLTSGGLLLLVAAAKEGASLEAAGELAQLPQFHAQRVFPLSVKWQEDYTTFL